jgi:phosphoribosylglycinamide formyltransferase-1
VKHPGHAATAAANFQLSVDSGMRRGSNSETMARTKIAALISGGGRTVLNIAEEIRAGRLDADLSVVIASRQCKGIERCRAAGMEVHLVALNEMPGQQAYCDAIAKILDDAEVDLVIMAGFLSLWRIPPNYVGRVMNIHPALLPRFGGKGMYGHHVHEAVLKHGCKISGCTVHFVDNEYDSGPIIVQKCVPVFDTDSPDDLADRVFEQECKAFPEAIKLFSEGKITIDGQIVRIAR